jgi:phage-related protein
MKMPFYAKSFIFDNIPSEFYNAYIGSFDGAGDSRSSGSNNVDLLTQKLFRRPSPLFYGAEQIPVLQFSLSCYFQKEIMADEYTEIASWLFGQQQYKELRICQEDMQETYFNAFFTSPEIVRMGNKIQGFTATVICDSPWGWKPPKSYEYNFSGVNVSSNITFLNESDNAFYTYPTSLVITTNAFGGSISITNVTDLNRVFYTTLLPYEVLTLNCDLQFMSSTLAIYPLGTFNKNWLRFVSGKNNLSVVGNILNIQIESPIAVKVA